MQRRFSIFLVSVTAFVLSACNPAQPPQLKPADVSYTLTVEVTGAGTVTSIPAGISCDVSCAASFADNTELTLLAEAKPGYMFTGWTGACDSNEACILSLNQDASVTANFAAQVTQQRVSVSEKLGLGTGIISSTPTGILCGDSCTADFAEGSEVTLTASASETSSFGGWGGDCEGISESSCTFTVTKNSSVTAAFDLLAPDLVNHTLTVVPSGEGNGLVSSSPAGLVCGEVCSASFLEGTLLTLTATPDAQSEFVAWTGACGGKSCTVNLKDAQTVGAIFAKKISLYTLSVTTSGNGTVTGGGMNCGASCTLSVAAGTQVELLATPAADATFSAWGGACAGTSSCSLTVTENLSVSANFAALPTHYALELVTLGAGSGTVSSGDFSCGATCSPRLERGSQTTFSATASPGSSFAGWAGACAHTRATCTVTLNSDETLNAVFYAGSAPGLAVIDGYTDAQSYEQNSLQTVFVNASSTRSASIDLYDVLGNVVDSVSYNAAPQSIKNAQPWQNGYGYDASFVYHTGNLDSGLYFWDNKIPFAVKDSSRASKIRVVWPTNTLNAYTCSGGRNFYNCGLGAGDSRPSHLSFERPLDVSRKLLTNSGARVHRDFGTESIAFFWWLEQQPQLGSYGALVDKDLENAANLDGADTVIIPGHSEYWTRQARENIDAFVAAGGNLIVLSGNTMWWQVRFEDGKLVCYKSFSDPVADPRLETVLWTTTSLYYQPRDSIGADFIRGGIGNSRTLPSDAPSSYNGYKIVSANSPLLEGTGLTEGDIVNFDWTAQSEYDGALLSGFDTRGYPVIDTAALNAYRVELLGFDYGYYRNKTTVGTFIAFQKTASSGIVVNTATNVWATAMANSSNAAVLQKITANIIVKLGTKQTVFSPDSRVLAGN